MVDESDDGRAWWWGLAALLAVAMVFVVHAFVGTFVLGLFLYYAARPVHRRLTSRLQSPTLAATIALFVLALPVVVLFGYTAALAVGELAAFVNSDLSGFEELLAPYLDIAGTSLAFQETLTTLLSDPARLLNEQGLRSLAGSLTASLGVVFVGLLHLFVAVALSFYLLRDGDRLGAWTGATVDDDLLWVFGRAVDRDLQTVFFGNILNALLTGVIAAVVFSGLAAVAPVTVPVPVPFLLGLLAGAASLVPVVGMKLVYAPITLVLTARALLFDPAALWFPVLFLVVTAVVVDTIPDLVIRPYVSGRNLHVGAVMFAYIFGPLLFGWYGLFLGPLILVVVANFARIILPELVGSRYTAAPMAETGALVDRPIPPDHGTSQVSDGGAVSGEDESGAQGTRSNESGAIREDTDSGDDGSEGGDTT